MMRKYLSLNTVASKENIFNSVYEAMSIFAITSYNFFNQFGKLIYFTANMLITYQQSSGFGATK